jgi:uncharacterized membrane protein
MRLTGKLTYLSERLGTSIWLIPLALCAVSALLAILMLWFDRFLEPTELDWTVFSLEPDAARNILGIIAGSIIGVGGVAFSVTMVALTLTSGQYGPKVLRNFLEDNHSKVTLGLFLGTYVYTLVVLSGYASVDKPKFTVFLALVLAFAALLGFVRFIHRTATDLQADHIVQRIGRQLQQTLRCAVNDVNPDERIDDTSGWRRSARNRQAYAIVSNQHGYIQTIDYSELISWCTENNCLLQVRDRAGDFIVEGLCVFKVYAGDEGTPDNAVDELNASMIVGPMRTPVQDTEYAITQLNQLAARALSPGINDPGTAITCIDWFSLALTEIIDRDLPGCVFLDDNHHPRLIAHISDFSGIVKAIYAPLRQLSRSDVAVTASLLESLCRLAELTQRPDRLEILALHGKLIHEGSDRRDGSEFDNQDIRQRYKKLTVLTQPLGGYDWTNLLGGASGNDQ